MPGKRIVINASFRDLPFGTGISTYSRTLGRAVGRLGHEVAWLSGARAPAATDSMVDKAVLADRPPAPGGALRQSLNTARLMAKGAMSGALNARPVIRDGETVFLVPELYESAHYRHMLLRKFCEVQLPGRADLLHLTAPLPIRMRDTPTVTTIHDLAPILHPGFTPDDKAEFIARVRMSAKLSDLVLTVSEAARAEILDTLDLPPRKVIALHQPVDIALTTAADDDAIARTLQRFGLSRGDYIFWVGAIEPKKNVRRLIEAYAESKLDMPLVLAGRPAWFADQELGWMETALAPAIRQRVRLIGYVSGDDLRRLYAGATMFAFPSLYEGFGLPALEAMTMGCPVVASSTPALAEVCGDAALFADPLDRDSIRQQLEQMAGDAALRQRLAAAGRERAKAFSFESYVENLGNAYTRIGVDRR